jgi:apolipoprotein N-acyltransferase
MCVRILWLYLFISSLLIGLSSDSFEDNILLTLKKYVSEISKNKTDLVLWPESTITGFIPYSKKFYNEAKNLVNTAGGLNIIGTPYNEGYKAYNSVLYFENAFEYKTVHKKNHLLPFGEFIPFTLIF